MTVDFPPFLIRDNFCNFLFVLLHSNPFLKWVYVKRKVFASILSSKSRPLFRRKAKQF